MNIGFRFSEAQQNYESIITITYKNEKKHTKETCLHHFAPKKINFLEETPHLLRLTYQEDEIKISVGPVGQGQALGDDAASTKINSIKLPYYLAL